MQIAVETSEAPNENFLFERIDRPLLSKALAEQAAKWGLAHSLKLELFKFDKHFTEAESPRFLSELAASPAFQGAFPSLSGKDSGEVKFQKGRCTCTTTDLFQKLEGSIVFKDSIRGRMTEMFEEIQVCDMLRECILLEESQHFCLFSQDERRELLFRIFQALVLGGQMCQYQDKLSPYVQAAKEIYKLIVQVRLDPASQQVFAESKFYEVLALGKAWRKGYSPQSFLFVVVSEASRRVFVIHNEWIRVW